MTDIERRREEVYQKRDIILAEIHTDVKHLLEWSKQHTQDDKEKFDKLDKDNQWRDKVIYGGLGIVGFVVFISHFIK